MKIGLQKKIHKKYIMINLEGKCEVYEGKENKGRQEKKEKHTKSKHEMHNDKY